MKHVAVRSGRKEILQDKYVSGPDDNPHRFRTSPINWNKKKAEVNCSFEDVEFSMQSNEDIRNWNNFSAVWSYCMEQTDRQLLCPTKMLLENRCLSATQCTQLGKLETQLAVWAPQSHPLDEIAHRHHCQTWEMFFSTSPQHLVLISSRSMGSELPIITNWALFLSC